MGTQVWYHPLDPEGHLDKPSFRPRLAARTALVVLLLIGWIVAAPQVLAALVNAALRERDIVTARAIVLSPGALVMGAIIVALVIVAFFPKVRRLQTVQDVVDAYRSRFADLLTERAYALLLDRRMRLIQDVELGAGNVAATPVDTRSLIRTVLKIGVEHVILIHNHPSGDPAPSATDISLTRRLATALKLLGVDLTDHVIFARGDGWFSMRKKGLL